MSEGTEARCSCNRAPLAFIETTARDNNRRAVCHECAAVVLPPWGAAKRAARAVRSERDAPVNLRALIVRRCGVLQSVPCGARASLIVKGRALCSEHALRALRAATPARPVETKAPGVEPGAVA